MNFSTVIKDASEFTMKMNKGGYFKLNNYLFSIKQTIVQLEYTVSPAKW